MSTTETVREITAAPQLPEAAAFWSLPTDRFWAALATAARPSEVGGSHVEQLVRLALYLVLEAPAGPPASPAEFLDRTTIKALARAWSGEAGTERWTGVQGADLLIAAVGQLTENDSSPLAYLFVRCRNAFRRWATDPHALRLAATAAGIDPAPGLTKPTTTEKEN